MGRFFGREGHIVLYGFGGLAVGSNALSNRWQRIAVSFAGPLAGFVLLAAVLAAYAVFAPQAVRLLLLQEFDIDWEFGTTPAARPHPLLLNALSDLYWINLYWGLINLLPVWPLDGGQVSRDLLEWLIPDKGIRVSLAISCTVAALLALNALAGEWGTPFIPYVPAGGMYCALLFGLLAIGSYQAMQAQPSRPQWERNEESSPVPWERDADWWKR
jgi:Zn-dependent protease